MSENPKPTGPGLKTFFDPENVERHAPDRPWRTLAAAALSATIILTLGWEFFWRANWHEAGDFDNSSGLWARQREKATGDATVLIGSSRMLFDVDLDVWEEVSGVRPVQLATEGTSPRIFLEDFAKDEKFKGLLIVGVTAPLFFTQRGGRREDLIDYYRDETPSERWDYFLSSQIEKIFAYTDDATRPKSLLQAAPFPAREGMKPKVFIRKLSRADADRNTEMWRRVEEDAAFQQLARDNWVALLKQLSPPPGPKGEPPPPMPDAAIDAVIAEVKGNVEKIRARGGDVAFMRFPYDGFFAVAEDNGFPRQRFWDSLIEKTQTAGISFHDHPELQGYKLAEWSHLTASEAERYTRALAPIFYAEYGKRRSSP